MSTAGGVGEAGRESEVLACLDSVTDPELDEPVTDLGFVEEVTVGADGAVSIDFRLPTFWCAANFAYMMAEDMRDAVCRVAVGDARGPAPAGAHVRGRGQSRGRRGPRLR